MRKKNNHSHAAQANLPGMLKDKTPPGYDQVARAIRQSATIADLQSRFKASILNAAFALMLARQPELAAQALGEPAGSDEYLIDECLGFSPVIPTYQNFGKAQAVRMLYPASTKDPELFAHATERGSHAIITRDAARRGPKDLCFIANRAFKADDGKAYPGVIVIPSNSPDPTNTLLAYKARILDYLSGPKLAVLDL